MKKYSSDVHKDFYKIMMYVLIQLLIFASVGFFYYAAFNNRFESIYKADFAQYMAHDLNKPAAKTRFKRMELENINYIQEKASYYGPLFIILLLLTHSVFCGSVIIIFGCYKKSLEEFEASSNNPANEAECLDF